jgi:hypothetical protein
MIHLNTLAGGRNVATLRPMLEHYRSLKVESFIVNVHLSRRDDPILDEIRSITRDFGVPIASVSVGHWLEVLRRVYRESRKAYPNDWHILADQDELHVYPMEISELEKMCNEREYHYVCGCWVDRLGADGGFPQIDHSRPIWEQFPTGAFLSYPVAAADPRKVVLAKSDIDVCVGQHLAWSGKGCPISEAFVQVHHFKWIAGIVAELEVRANSLKQGGYGFHVESSRFVKYFREHGGRADLNDRRILAARCGQGYEYWPMVQKWLMVLNNYVEVGRRFIPGPSSLAFDLSAVELGVETLASSIKLADSGGHDRGGEHDDPIFGLEPVRQIWLYTRH